MRLSLLAAAVLATSIAAPAGAAPDGGAYRFAFTTIEGEPLPLESFRGRPVLVVNTASRCGFTHQYAELQQLWTTHRARGLVVLGVPSNDFNQELASNAAIKEFCEVNFDINFPMTEMVHVRGPDSHPLFAWFRAELGAEAGPRWNFYKFLITPEGAVAGAWPSTVPPTGREITAAIEPHLAPAGS
jgi:glutathione peroxidase